MFRKYSALTLVVLLAACSTTGATHHKGKTDKADASNAKLFVIQEDMPAESQSLASGQDVLNRLIHMGRAQQPNIEASPVVISSLAEDIEKPVADSMGEGVKTYSFKGKDKPSDVRGWLNKQGVKQGRILDTQVDSWGVKPYPGDKYHYVVYLNTKTTLTDASNGKILGSYECQSDTSDVAAEKAPTKYELLKDEKALLKKMYRGRSSACAAKTEKNL